MVCASLFGFLTGCWVAAMSPIFIRILGPDLLSSAFGLLTAIRGTAGLVGPPLAGFAVDYFCEKYFKIYNLLVYSFFPSRLAAIILSGACMTVSSVFFITATFYSAWRDTRALEHAGTFI